MKCKECKKSDCKHENVKYHPCCMKVRCDNCGMEWLAAYIQKTYISYVPYVEPCVQPSWPPYWTGGTGDTNPWNQGS